MTKRIIIVVVVLITMAMTYVGIRNDMIRRADAEEEIVYTVHVAKNTDYGYVPKHDFEMSKPSLEAHVKLCWWEASWLESGDLLLAFDADEDTWFVKLAGNDREIKELQKIVKKFDLLCTIPER